ncbi:aminopeptidase N-like isoform X2 [Ptychodera flava]|uniref:aminopeptidase N-like isoform X2 n=1 Tax=Ptychodera flava TaxID=63121 RepID=UPI00396A2CD3
MSDGKNRKQISGKRQIRSATRPNAARNDLYVVDVQDADVKHEQGNGFFVTYRTAAILIVIFVLVVVCVALIGGLVGRARSNNRQDYIVNTTSTSLPTTLDPSIPWYRVQLPKNLMPSHYNLEFTLDLDKFKFTGNVVITVTCTSDTDVVIVHTRQLNISQDNVAVKDLSTGSDVEITQQFEFTRNRFYVLLMKENLKSGKEYEITFFEFKGMLRQDLFGIYLSSYDVRNEDGMTVKGYAIASQFEPTYARKAFPCFDEPAMKATFSISIIRAHRYRSLSNGKKLSTNKLHDSSWYRDVFETTPVMSTYHLAVVLSDFDSLELTRPNGKIIRVWARDDVISQTQFALNVANWSYGYFEEYFGVEDPIQKSDLFVVPDHPAKGMENWGLITLRESATIVDEEKSAAKVLEDTADLIAHEIAHMWFGNMVTPKWWTDLWLKEGFASMFASEALNHIFPDWRMNEMVIAQSVLPALEMDAFMNSHPLSSPINNPDDIVQFYDVVTYWKGLSVIYMLRYFVGETIFRSALQNYIKKYMYSNADMDELWEEFSEAANSRLQIKEIMDTWTLQKGYPVVTLSRDSSSSMRKLNVKQSHFTIQTEVSDIDINDSPYRYQWFIYFAYLTHTNRTPKGRWLEMNSSE